MLAVLALSPRTRHEPVTRGVAGPWRGQRCSLVRLSVRCHPPAPLPRHAASVSLRGAGPGSWRCPRPCRGGSGAAEQMLAASGWWRM